MFKDARKKLNIRIYLFKKIETNHGNFGFNFTPSKKEPDNIYICVDNDEPGKEFVSRMTQDVKFQFKSQKDVVFQPNMPNECKDWNDYLKIVTNNQDIKQTQNVQIEHEQLVKAEQSEKEDVDNYQNKKKKTFFKKFLCIERIRR